MEESMRKALNSEDMKTYKNLRDARFHIPTMKPLSE